MRAGRGSDTSLAGSSLPEQAERSAASLSRSVEQISGELALEPLLVRIVESAIEPLGADHGTIGLVKERPTGPVGQGHIGAFERRTGLAVEACVSDDVAVPGDVAYAISRIAQEALTNVAKHADARRVSVTLQEAPSGTAHLFVADDGRGFDPGQVEPGSLGLLSMRERAASIQARLEVSSRPGVGTTVTLDWPVGGDGPEGDRWTPSAS